MVDPKATGVVDREIGARIRERREAVGYSQAYVADIIGISFQQLQKYEIGENRVAAAMLVRLAQALRVEPASLLPHAKRTVAPTRDTSSEDLLAEQLQHAFSRIASVKDRRLVLNMARSLSTSTGKSGGATPPSSRPRKLRKR